VRALCKVAILAVYSVGGAGVDVSSWVDPEPLIACFEMIGSRRKR